MITYLPFNQIFPVLLVTMDDLKMIEKYYLPFSEDGLHNGIHNRNRFLS